MNEINRLRRNQLAIFGCSRNAGDPKRIQCQKFIISERIEENGATKSRVDTVTDIGLEKLSELRLVRPALVPVFREVLRVSERFGDRNGRYNGSSRHSHDRRRRCRLRRRERGQAYALEASPEACAIGRVQPAAGACSQRFQSTPVACDCRRPEQCEESVLDVNWHW